MILRLATVTVLFIAALSPSGLTQGAGQQPGDATAFLESVDDKLHSPWSEMGEFSAVVTMSGLFLPGSTIRYLWRRHGTSEVRLEGLPNPAIAHMLDGPLREDAFDKIMREVSLPPMLEQFRGCDLELSREGELQRLDVVSLRPDTAFRKQAVWFDERLIPLRYEAENENDLWGRYNESTEMFYEEVAGRWVPTKAISESDNPSTPPVPIETEFRWEQIGEHFVVTGATLWALDGEARTIMLQISFEDVRIDQGFGDPPQPGAVEFLSSSRTRTLSLGALASQDGPGDRQRVGLTVDQAGPITVTARSFSFPPTLILRDVDGNVVARAEAAGPTAVLHADVPARSTFSLDVSRYDGLPGDVELTWAPGLATPEPPDEQFVTNQVGRMLGRSRLAKAAGSLQEAEAQARRALAVVKQHIGSLSASEGEAQLELSESLNGQGRIDESLQAGAAAIAIFDSLQDPRWLNAHISRAEALHESGRLAEARSELEICLSMAGRLGSSMGDMLRASLNFELAGMTYEQGRIAEATDIFQQVLSDALKVDGEDGRLTLLTRMELSEALYQMDRFDEAAEQLAAATRSALRSRGIHHALTQNLLRFQAMLAQAQGDHDLASERLADLIDLREAVADEDDPLLLVLIANLAQVELSRGEPELARELMQRSLAGAGRVYGHESQNMAVALSDLGDLLIVEGRPAEALARHAESARLRRKQLERELTALTEQQRLRWAATQRGIVDGLVMLALQLDEADSAGLAYDEVRNWKGLVSRGLLRERRWLDRDADPELQALVRRLRRTVTRLSSGALGAGWQATGQGEEDGEEAFDLNGLLAERRTLEERIARRARGSASSTGTTLPQIQKRLGTGEALVDLVMLRGQGSDRAAAFVTRASGPVALVDLGPASGLSDAVSAHLDRIEAGRGVLRDVRGRALGSPGRPAATGPTAGLRALLWEPLAEHLQDVELVFLCPEAELATVPFETIAGEVAGSFLIEEHAFVYQQSPADLLTAREPRRTDGRIVVVGGVDYDAAAPSGTSRGAPQDDSRTAANTPPNEAMASGEWPRLPGTDLEAQEIAALHAEQSVELLTGQGASEESLRKAVPGARVVHLATHGFFAPIGVVSQFESALPGGAPPSTTAMQREFAGLVPGLMSGIVLAGANAPPANDVDDGLLTAEEAAWLDLSACEMVVLSACETGLGTPSGGENLIGLRRAFYLAGAESRITSLWKVDDQATKSLMHDFYRRRIHDGQGRSQALRGAQLALLAHQRSQPGGLALPSTWGAFVLEGAWW